jgi:chaperonin cofactor prefoldin
MNSSTLQLIKEIEDLKKKIKLYEISTKLDYEKIQWLKDEIIYLKYINDMR